MGAVVPELVGDVEHERQRAFGDDEGHGLPDPLGGGVKGRQRAGNLRALEHRVAAGLEEPAAPGLGDQVVVLVLRDAGHAVHAAVDAAGVRQEALGQQPIAGAEDPDEPVQIGPLKRDEQLVQPAGPLRPLDQAERQAGPVRVPVGGREPAAALELHGHGGGTKQSRGRDVQGEGRVRARHDGGPGWNLRQRLERAAIDAAGRGQVLV